MSGRRGRPIGPAISEERLRLNNGVMLPALGLGTFRSTGADGVEAVVAALRAGYRLIDTAAAYDNEVQIGEGLRASGIPRGEVVIETKVWVTDYGADETRRAFEKAERKLGVDTIDLVLLHKPLPEHFDRTVAAYRALESLCAEGRVRAIGVSNFLPHHLDALLDRVATVPAVNQIELHPYFIQRASQSADAERGILTQAWSPIGGVTHYPGPWGDHRLNVLADPVLATIGERHGKTPAQIMLRWGLQQGRSVVPKSSRPERIRENANVFDFRLSQDELDRVDALDRGIRNGTDPDRPSTFDRIIPDG